MKYGTKVTVEQDAARGGEVAKLTLFCAWTPDQLFGAVGREWVQSQKAVDTLWRGPPVRELRFR